VEEDEMGRVCSMKGEKRNAFKLLVVWGRVSMCDTPPTLIIVHFDLVQHFIEDTVLQLTTGN
jgi:hypothetical protein